MARRSGLGRGLDALIPGGDESQNKQDGINRILVDLIKPNPMQPRTEFDERELESLADSIREHGVLQPLIVSHTEKENEYELIAGERRLLAAKKAGLRDVPAIVVAVTNTLRLLKLPKSVREALMNGIIQEGHARTLLTLSTPQAQAAALQVIINKGLSVRQTEILVRKMSGERPKLQKKADASPEIVAIEEQLRAALGTKVSVKHGKKGGTITIHYYSDEEFDSILEKLI